MIYKKNGFGDIFPDVNSVPAGELTERLTNFVEALKEQEAGCPFIIRLVHEPRLTAIHSAGFTLRHATNAQSEWIITNGSPIPVPYTARGGIQMVIEDKGNILMMEEWSRKGICGLVCGNVDMHELIQDAARREVKEELDLDVLPEHVKLIASLNRLKSNREEATEYSHFYYMNRANMQGNLNIDPKEVLRVLWVPAAQLAESESVEGLRVNAMMRLIAKHVMERCVRSRRLVMPDCYKADQKGPGCDPATLGVMHVELIAQDIDGDVAV